MPEHVLLLPSWYPDAEMPTNGIFFKEQAQTLVDAGVRVGVVACRLGEGLPRRWRHYSDGDIETSYYHGPAQRCPVPLGDLRHYTGAFARGFDGYVRRAGRPDIVHVHSAVNAGPAALILSRRTGVPFVVTEHYTGYARGALSPLHLALLRRVFAAAAGVAVVSPSLGEVLESTVGPAASNWRWIPNMVDPSFVPAAATRKGHFRFLNVGALHEKKGHEELLRAFAMAFPSREDTELVIGGAGHLLPHLEDLSRSLGLADRVKFLGGLSRDEVLRNMQECNAFVLSSHFETFGVVIIEAMACGKPCVATACGGPEHILDEDTGILVSPRNIEELAQAMTEVRRSESRFFPETIRRRCRERFSGDELLVGLSELYAIATG